MSEAEKKRKELATLTHLRTLLTSFPQGSIVPGEEPDFIITLNDGRRVGVELTELHREVSQAEVAPQSQEALRHRIVRRTQEIYVTSGGPFLDVSVLFANIELTKASVQPLAQKIAEIVVSIIPAVGEVRYAKPDYRNENDFPEEIHHVRVFKLPDATRNFFSAPGATWVATLQHEDVERVLSAKNERCLSYRNKADEVWLVISCNGEYMSTWFKGTAQIQEQTFQTKFDRVFLLSHFEHQVIEIRRHGTTDV